MKRCFRCLENKPLEAFYKHARMSDGRLNKCKECTKADTLKNRLANIEYYRSYDRARASQPKRKMLAKRIISEWKAQFPNRRKAQVILGNAVRDKRIEKQPCFICGGKAEAHHPDYDRPLDVVWLCSAHHKQAHAMARQLLKAPKETT